MEKAETVHDLTNGSIAKTSTFLMICCFLTIVGHAKVANACTVPVPDPSLFGTPADGDVAIPTDVVPYYAVPIMFIGADQIPGEFTLTSENGASISLTPKIVNQTFFELTPERKLDPTTVYVLRADWIHADDGEVYQSAIRFTTGDGPLAEPPHATVARLIHYYVKDVPLDTCGQWGRGTCVLVEDDDAFIQYVYIDEFGQDQAPSGARGSFMGTDIRFMQDTNFTCVRLRTRALNGTFSEPTTLCGADYPVQEITTTNQIRCTSTGIELDPPQYIVSVLDEPFSVDASVQTDGGTSFQREEVFNESDSEIADEQKTDLVSAVQSIEPANHNVQEENYSENAGGCSVPTGKVPGNKERPSTRLVWLLLFGLAFVVRSIRRCRRVTARRTGA